jgi:hypothetical protein
LKITGKQFEFINSSNKNTVYYAFEISHNDEIYYIVGWDEEQKLYDVNIDCTAYNKERVKELLDSGVWIKLKDISL